MKTKENFKWNYVLYYVIELPKGDIIGEFELLTDAQECKYKYTLLNVTKKYIIQKQHSIATIV